MAKKSTATRQANAARRSQTTAKPSGATLVRANGQETKETTTGAVATQPAPAEKPASTPAAVSAAKPRVAVPQARPRALEAPKPAKPAPKMEAAPARQPNTTRTQASRVARARATQQRRAASVITPEHYAYVLKDLRLIAALAITMFAIIIILHFVLG